MLYFAYGSNLNMVQMDDRCPGADPIGPGQIKGWELNFRGPLDIQRKKGSVAHGFVWQVTTSHLKALDRYEGYPRLYTRIKIPVVMVNKIIHAWVYTMVRKGEVSLPSQSYFNAVVDGYYHCGMANKIECLLTAVERVP